MSWDEARAWRRKLRKHTRAIFVETPVNPSCRVLDLRPISYLTRNSGLALVVDSTFASPVNFRPLEHPKREDVVLTPHLGFVNDPVFSRFGPGVVENLGAWLDEKHAIPGEPADIPDGDNPKH